MFGLLSRLLRNRKASVLPMMAAAMIPLIGIIGSGLDLSRAYMAKAKLQTACDAAALATRRHMANGVTLGQTSIDEGRKFFTFNFPPGMMDIAAVTPTIRQNATDLSIVEVSATAQVPTTMMKVFGKNFMEVQASCSADQDFVHNDIMVVLDVTASMNCTAGTGSSCAYAATEQTNSRLSRLRNAAAALYRALQGATGVRIRYGFMPYSMTVNVGDDLNANWIRGTSTYHRCSVYNNNGSCRTWDTDTNVTRSSTWLTNNWAGCIEERSDVGGAAWPISISGAVTQADIDTTGTTPALQWQPYDDESTTGEYNAIAANLTRFCPAPARRLATYATEAAFQAEINTILAPGNVGGYTNHDLGMIWAMRYLSRTGMFAADNPTAINDASGNPVRVDRHIVFLTDGAMTANNTNYSSFGIPARSDRMSGCAGAGSETCLASKHRTRFLAACNRARQPPISATVWVIALDVGSTADISPCASGSDHFFISNGSDLSTVFTTIGRGIGKLRVVS